MRGSRTPAIRPLQSEAQQGFVELSRHRRSKLARAAQTTLVKADQWGRGDAVSAEVATALDGAFIALQKKTKKG